MSRLDWEQATLLASKAIAGDKVAYSEFLTVLSRFLRPRLMRSLPSSAVEDALQETLMAIHKSLHTLDLSRSLASWVSAIAHYKIQDQLRVIYRNSVLEELDEGAFSKETQMESVEEEKITELLKGLSSKEVDILKLLKLEGFSVNEVASKMKMTPSNVKVTAFRAIRKLRETLAHEDFYEDG